MIYLIDDNISNLCEQYFGVKFLIEEKYKSLLKTIEHFVAETHIAELEKATAILYHRGTPVYSLDLEELETSESVMRNIRDLVSKKGGLIPLAFFSDGRYLNYEQNKTPHYISDLRKSDFYQRLQSFLDHFLSTGRIHMPILAYGHNWRHQELTAAADPLRKAIRAFQPQEFIPSSVISSDAMLTFFCLALSKDEGKSIIENLLHTPTTKNWLATRIDDLCQF